MQVLKKIVISGLMAISMVGMSSTAWAQAEGAAEVRAAAEETIAKIQEAVAVAEKGGNKEEIVKIINDARQAQKKFRYEITERQRQKANDKLRIARDEFDAGESKPAEAKLKEALASFVEMKATYDANH